MLLLLAAWIERCWRAEAVADLVTICSGDAAAATEGVANKALFRSCHEAFGVVACVMVYDMAMLWSLVGRSHCTHLTAPCTLSS